MDNSISQFAHEMLQYRKIKRNQITSRAQYQRQYVRINYYIKYCIIQRVGECCCGSSNYIVTFSVCRVVDTNAFKFISIGCDEIVENLQYVVPINYASLLFS